MTTPEKAPTSALAGLAAEADMLGTIDGDAPGAAPGQGGQAEPAEPAPPSNAVLIAGMLELGRDVFCQFTSCSSPKIVLQPPTCNALGEAWAKVLDKRGISLHQYMGNYGEEIAAVVMTWAIGQSLYRSVGAEMLAREAMAKANAARTVTADAEASGDGGS